MALDPDRKDKSYQYGRLLAVLEKAEKDVLEKNNLKRETNAIRMMSRFTKQPYRTFVKLYEKVRSAYYPKLNPQRKNYYDNLIGEILDNIDSLTDIEREEPLRETYLLGYHMQRKAFYTPKKKAEEEAA